MKVSFFSSVLNHHQLPFSLACEKILGKGNFTFVASLPISKERLELGYPDLNSVYDFVLRSYENEKNYQMACEIAQNNDIVIFGVAPEYLVQQRIRENKITFRYQERIFDRSRWSILSPRVIKSMLLNHTRYSNNNTYMLCASAYTAGDYRLGGAYKNKCFKWGYFPPFEKYDFNLNLDRKNNQQIKILWVGRFLDWKHPEKVIDVAAYLTKKKYNFHIDMIGAGPEGNNLIDLISRNNLKDKITLLGSMPTEKVRKQMGNANIFLFTSNRQEGWGVVLNEAMNSGCAIVASYEAGSVPYLLKNGYNGFIYKKNDTNELCKKVERLVCNNELREKIGKNAYLTIAEEWNAENAARKLFKLCENLRNGSDGNIFSHGVLSKDHSKL